MTRVIFEQKKNTYTITCVGHASTERMCAAISALLYSIAGWAKNYAQNAKIKLKDGDAKIRYRHKDDDIQNLAKVGFLQLQRVDPANIVVEDA